MSTSREPELRAGDAFGGYEIVRRLGSGGFGAVYEALRLPLRRRTALKVLHREHAEEPETLDRFLREAEIVARMEHPHIVAVYDVGVHEGRPYIAMELLDGESLAGRLDREGALPVAAVVDVMLAVISAVAAVHAQGIVHRDLKPDNIHLARQATGGTVPKLLDFGIAKVTGAGRALTATNAIMGTPQYMSPEQARESKHVDAQSDQWALAVIVFECVTGRSPFAAASTLAVLVAITAMPAPRLRAVRPDLPEALEAVLLRAMAPEPGQRWSSVRAFGEALLPFASPAAQAQWAGFYAATAADAAELGRRSTLPPALVEEPSPTAAPRQETLEPATRSSIQGMRRTTRLHPGLAGGVAGVALALVAGAWLAMREPAANPSAPAVVAASHPPPTIAEVAPPPRPTVVEAAASPVAALPDAGAPAAPVAPVAVAVAAEVTPATGRHHQHHRAAGGGERAPHPRGEAFPNF